MAGSIGSSRCWRRLPAGLLLSVLALGLAPGTQAAPPDYVSEALAAFSADLPAGWSYTTTTVRTEVSTTERFDPAQPAGAQWTLLRYNGRPPTVKELKKYQKLRAANPTPASPANFSRTDIDTGSLRLLREDAERAEFSASFREESAGADKMLRRLVLRLTFNKRHPHVERFLLTLSQPYTPILGVKMNELRVETTFSPPGPGRPSLPATTTSHFAGRIFFIGTTEDLQVTYSDFVPVR